MRKLGLFLFFMCVAVSIAGLVLAQEVQQPIAPTVQTPPTEAGVYTKNGDNWDRLYAAGRLGEKIGPCMFSCNVVVSYRGATSPLTVDSARPGFFVVGEITTAPRDVFMVRLQKKKDHRELSIGSSAPNGNKFKNKYPDEDNINLEVHDSGHKRVIAPKGDLTPGEYLLILDVSQSAAYGYDFTVPASVAPPAPKH